MRLEDDGVKFTEKELLQRLERWSVHHLAGQRWFPSKESWTGTWRILDYLSLSDSDVVLIIAELDQDGRYFLPMRFSEASEGRTFLDAVGEPDFHGVLTDMEGGRRQWRGQNGEFIAIRTDKPLSPAGNPDVPLSSSTNSLALPKRGGFIKSLRQLRAGVHPEVFALSSMASTENPPVPDILGWLSYRHDSGEEYTLAIWEEYLTSSGTAWRIFSRYAQSGQISEITAACVQLGETTARLHHALIQSFPVEPWRVAEFQLWRQSLRDTLANPALQDKELLNTATDWLAKRARPLMLGKKIRVHGDLHLEQLLQTLGGWIVVDFEGEPLRSMEERNLLVSPLKDIATMIRSFDYLALEEHLEPETAKEWIEAFLNGYLRSFGNDCMDYLPEPWQETLRLFLLERVIYEWEYEARLRPERQWVPVAGLSRLLRGETV